MSDKLLASQRVLEAIRRNRVLRGIANTVPWSVKIGLYNKLTPDHENVVELGGGAKLSYHSQDFSWVGTAERINEYEPETRFVLDRFLSPKTLFIDCGANIGLWSSMATTKIPNRDLVVAVEPSDDTLKQLRRNCELNRNGFTVVDAAISDKPDETRTFYVYPNPLTSSLTPQDHLTDERPIEVKTETIDRIAERAIGKVPECRDVVVKIDIEGGEIEALKGARATLENYNTLIAYEDRGMEQNSDTTRFFMSQGLNIYYVDPKSFRVREVRDEDAMKWIKTVPEDAYNFVATKPGSQFDAQLQSLVVHALSADAADQKSDEKLWTTRQTIASGTLHK